MPLQTAKRWHRKQLSNIYTYIYIAIYIYAVELLSGPSLAFWGVIIWSKFVFSFNSACQKALYKQGFQHICLKRKIARKQIRGYCLVQVGHFLSPKLGPDNNPYLDQIIKSVENIAFHIVQNTTEKQKNILLQPPSWPNIGVFWNIKTLMSNKKYNLN